MSQARVTFLLLLMTPRLPMAAEVSGNPEIINRELPAAQIRASATKELEKCHRENWGSYGESKAKVLTQNPGLLSQSPG